MSETSSRVRLMANLQAAVAEAVSGTMEERGRGFASDREAWAELKECIERTKQMHTDIEKVHKEMWSAVKDRKWNGKNFVKRESSSTSYYSMGAYMPGDDDIYEVDVDTLGELYKLWKEAKAADASCGEKGWKYHFYKHNIKEEKRSDGKPVFTDYVCEGKIYRRGNKVFFKPAEA